MKIFFFNEKTRYIPTRVVSGQRKVCHYVNVFLFSFPAQIKRVMKQGTNRDLWISERFMAGSLAGAFSQSVIYPMEVSDKLKQLW